MTATLTHRRFINGSMFDSYRTIVIRAKIKDNPLIEVFIGCKVGVVATHCFARVALCHSVMSKLFKSHSQDSQMKVKTETSMFRHIWALRCLISVYQAAYEALLAC